MTEGRFSYRWGIPILDQGDTRIPNGFFDIYHSIGVSRSEFLMIMHLARYQYESANSECHPSIATVAKQMGYSTRMLQKLLKSLETKEFLKRHYRSGQTTIYDFGGFSRAALAAIDVKTDDVEGGVNPSSGVGVNCGSGVGVNPSSPKEEKTRRKDKKNTDSEISEPEKTVPVTGTSSENLPPLPEGALDAPDQDALDEREEAFLADLRYQTATRLEGRDPIEAGHWADRQKNRPWLDWHPDQVRPRPGVSKEALQMVGALIQKQTGLVPTGDGWKGWVNALAEVWLAAGGDMNVVRAAVDEAWAREDRWKPSHPRGFVDLARKQRALGTAKAASRTPVGKVYE